MNTTHTSRHGRRAVIGALVLTVLGASALWAHDLFLRLDEYFVQPQSDVRIRVLNGTFSKSEGPVVRNRIRSLDLGTPTESVKLDTSVWLPQGDTTIFAVRTGESGTYVAGASLLPRSIAIPAKDFNTYLRTDGVPDVLEQRRRDNALDRPAKEMYQKHVKAVFQVGTIRSVGFGRVFGYPAELVPLENPYEVRPGGTLRVRALVDGQPVANQFVIAGGRTPAGGRIVQRSVRTNAEGIARITPLSAGIWYVKFIHMVPAAAGDTVDYHSKWATLTFAVARRKASSD